MIGGARASDDVLDLARELGEALVQAGYRIVCGGRTGIMAAVAEGAHRATRATGSDVIGILPSTDPGQANPYIDIVIPTGLGHARNVLVVAAGDAVVAVGGRSGTLSEIATAWTLGKPVIALSCTGGWAARLAGAPLDDRRDDAVIDAPTVASALQALRPLLTRA